MQQMSSTPVQSPAMLSSPTMLAQPIYEITDEDRKRQERIANAIKAYEGDLDKPLIKMPGQPDDNAMSNRMKEIVDGGGRFLFGKELEISVEESAPPEAQEALDATWGRKEKRIPLLLKLNMNGALAGQAFLRIVPQKKSGSFRLIIIDPSTIFVQTAPQDCETVLLYCIEYSTNGKRDGKPTTISYREEITRVTPDDSSTDADPYLDTDATWQIQHWSRVGDRGPWTPAGQPITWDYDFPPIFSCQNLPKPNDFWGYPDITPDLIGLNNALNLVLSDINRNGKLFAQPIIYSSGTGMQPLDIRPGRIIELPLDNSKIVAVPIHCDIPAMLAFAKDVRSDIDELSGVPGVATGRIEALPRGALSGTAIELLFMVLLMKSEGKRCTYGELIIDVSKAILVLSRMNGDIDITLAWQNPLPHDDLPAIQAAISKKEVGISDTTLQRELGYDPDEEMELSQSEDAAKLLAYSRGAGMPVLPPAVPGVQPLPGQPPAVVPGQSPFIGGHA